MRDRTIIAQRNPPTHYAYSPLHQYMNWITLSRSMLRLLVLQKSEFFISMKTHENATLEWSEVAIIYKLSSRVNKFIELSLSWIACVDSFDPWETSKDKLFYITFMSVISMYLTFWEGRPCDLDWIFIAASTMPENHTKILLKILDVRNYQWTINISMNK